MTSISLQVSYVLSEVVMTRSYRTATGRQAWVGSAHGSPWFTTMGHFAHTSSSDVGDVGGRVMVIDVMSIESCVFLLHNPLVISTVHAVCTGDQPWKPTVDRDKLATLH